MAMPPDELPVLPSAEWVVSLAAHVQIDDTAVQTAARQLQSEAPTLTSLASGFNTTLHFVDGSPLTAQYLLVVDALNFCFWPEEGAFEYEHLAGGLKASLLEDACALDASRLALIDGPGVQRLLRWPRPLPLQDERARLLRELGSALLAAFGGSAAQLVGAAGGSAVRLVQLVTQHLPGFRDHAVYKGRQVFFYKRAQIFVADLYGAFAGAGLGAFHDIHGLTMFADYRVPVVLCGMGLLTYSDALAAKVDGCVELAAGGEEEIEIRAASIVAVERLRRALVGLPSADAPVSSAGKAVPDGGRAVQSVEPGVPRGLMPPELLSIHLDWWLWAKGEAMPDKQRLHHRTLTVYY